MSDYLLDPVRLQFEISSMCNALCLGCVRTDSMTFNNKKDIIPNKEILPVDTFKKIILSPAFATADEIEFCGTIDDPLMHPDFLEMLKFLTEVKNRKFRVLIHTNASLRSPEYFAEMAKILQRLHSHVVRFSIDGLADTNHIYRQNTHWHKIIENAQAYIAAGGYAFWQFLIFPWNQHQIAEAKQLSVDMGFQEFASRHDRSYATKLGLEAIQKIKLSDVKKTGSSDDVLKLINVNTEIARDDINCDNKNKKMYFIGYDSRLWPCCFLHNGFMSLNEAKVKLITEQLINNYDDLDWNKLNKYTAEEVLQHRFYRNDLSASWQSNQHGTQTTDRIMRCSEVCGVKKLEKLPIGQYKVL